MAEPEKKNGVLSALSGNLSAILQFGALGLVGLFIYFVFSVTLERIKVSQEEFRTFREELQKERDHDARERAAGRQALQTIQDVLSRDHKELLREVTRVQDLLSKKQAKRVAPISQKSEVRSQRSEAGYVISDFRRPISDLRGKP